MFGIFSPKKRLQNALVATEDMRLVPAKLPVEKGYVMDDKTKEAWALTSRNLLTHRDSSQSVLFVFEREAAPPSFLGQTKDRELKKAFKENLKVIAREALNETLYGLQEDQERNKFSALLRFIILILAILAIVLVAAGLIMSGNLHLPF